MGFPPHWFCGMLILPTKAFVAGALLERDAPTESKVSRFGYRMAISFSIQPVAFLLITRHNNLRSDVGGWFAAHLASGKKRAAAVKATEKASDESVHLRNPRQRAGSRSSKRATSWSIALNKLSLCSLSRA
jgi:hypothetical protein